jgi:hypothetical protein
MLQHIIFDVTVHVFRCCTTYFCDVTVFIFRCCIIYFFHMFAMLHLKCFGALRTGGVVGNGDRCAVGNGVRGATWDLRLDATRGPNVQALGMPRG